MVYGWLHIAQSTLYPPRCALCEAPGHDGLDLCADCRADLPYTGHACATCAQSLPEQAPMHCPACRRKPPPFASTAAALRYEAPANWLVTQLKFHRNLSHARILGRLLAAKVADTPAPDRLLPMPLHRSRLQQRGFNQAGEIAAEVGCILDIPVDRRLAQRVRATAHQSDLPASQRRQNVRGAFTAGPTAAGLDIAIIDDVATTGQTAAELARALRRAGAAEVRLWVAARA